jgi:hypothetical protein
MFNELSISNHHADRLAIADFNNDGYVDIFAGSDDGRNKLFLNNGGNGTTIFDSFIEISSQSPLYQSGVVASDFNNDGFIAILLVGRGKVQLRRNSGEDGKIFDNPAIPGIDLPGIISSVFKTTTADINNEGFIDIIFTNTSGARNQLLLNNGNKDTMFTDDSTIIDLFGASDADTDSVAVADLNNDGYLDIIFGNHETFNEVLFYSPCPNGGAQLHSKSWCHRCPSYMGLHDSGLCKECVPDYVQEGGASEQCSLLAKCPGYEVRKLGDDQYSQ